MGELIGLGVTLLLIVIGLLSGRIQERRHFSRIEKREERFRGVTVTTLKTVPHSEQVVKATMVIGGAVIATDYFKGFVAGFKNLIGGEVKSYMTLMERARREAILRMIQQAVEWGATEIHNVRLETSNIRSSSTQRNQKYGVSVEVMAFGTAVVRGIKNESSGQ